MFDDVPTNYDSPVHHNKLNSMPQASSAPSFFFFLIKNNDTNKQTNKLTNKPNQRGQNKSKLIRTPSHYCSMKLIIMDWKSMYKKQLK